MDDPLTGDFVYRVDAEEDEAEAETLADALLCEPDIDVRPVAGCPALCVGLLYLCLQITGVTSACFQYSSLRRVLTVCLYLRTVRLPSQGR